MTANASRAGSLVWIVGGAFLLSWATEVAQIDISASFAIAILVLIAILPKYAIESVLAWKAGMALLGLFIVHLFYVETSERLIFAGIYIALSICLIIDWGKLKQVLQGPSRE